jgi:hypothetical protein
MKSQFTRRSFLKSTAIAACSLKTGEIMAAEPAKKIPVGVQVYCVRKLAEQAVRATAKSFR